jgi:MSHA biogenesis protein MshP
MSRTGGFSLVAVIFFMLIVGSLLTMALRLGAQSQQAGVLQLDEARAFQAAQTGLEWALNRLQAGGCPPSPTTFSVAGDLAPFAVTVNCSSRVYSEQGSPVTIFELDAVASRGTLGATPDFVARRVQMTVQGP